MMVENVVIPKVEESLYFPCSFWEYFMFLSYYFVILFLLIF